MIQKGMSTRFSHGEAFLLDRISFEEYCIQTDGNFTLQDSHRKAEENVYVTCSIDISRKANTADIVTCN